MEHLLSIRTSFSPIVIDYAQFLVNSGQAGDLTRLAPITGRLEFGKEKVLAEMKTFSDSATTSKQPFLMTKIKEEALLALSLLLDSLSSHQETLQSLQSYLLGVLLVFPNWKSHVRFSANQFIETISTRVSRSMNDKIEERFFVVIKRFVDWSLNDSGDVEYYGNLTSYLFRGLMINSSCLSPSALGLLINECVRILESGIYDLREFLPEAPIGTPLNELLRRYFVLPAAALAAAFHSLRNFKSTNLDISVNLEKICLVLITYTSSISNFLSNCETHEAELSGFLKLILKMLKVSVTIYSPSVEGNFAVVQTVIQSRSSFKNLANYREILSDSCQILLECAKIKPADFIVPALNCFRDAVVSLDMIEENSGTLVPINLYDTAASIGPYLGALFRLQLDRSEDRTVCEGILNSLISSAPESDDMEVHNTNAIISCPHAIATLGHIAGVSGDEQVALTCLANLTAQFNKGNYGETTRVFFTQFNLIAVTGSGALLANILDIYTNIISEGDLGLLTLAMDELGKSLVPLCKNEMIKLEVILFTLMRTFIERGLEQVKKSSKSTNAGNVGNLRPIIYAIWTLLEHVIIEDFINKAASVDLFQEFWFVLLFHGFQSRLNWDPLWAEFIPRISQKTPLLIKEKDRIQTAATISLSLLNHHTNPSLKSHLISLMPNCSSSARNISNAQCLWLLSFYQAEMNKLELGQTDTFMNYIKSDVVYYLDLYSFIEDLSLTILRDWLNRNMIKRHGETTKLALMVLRGCGNIQKRIHKTCLQFLKLILARERGLEGCQAIWTGLLEKLELLYKTCRAEMGILPDNNLVASGDYIKDPEYAKEAFEEVLKFSREVFQTASYLYPHEYYNFVMNYFQADVSFDSANVSYRNVALLELLKSCHPDANYIQLPLEMHRNSESHFKWHLLLPKLKREIAPEVDVNLLAVNSLWKNRLALSSKQLKDMMVYICKTELLNSEGKPLNLEHLRCLVHIPFLHAEHDTMNEACKMWSLMINRTFTSFGKSFFLLNELLLAFQLHKQAKMGIFAVEGRHTDPFKTKMSSSPSKSGKLELGKSISTYLLYFVDFLRERFLIDSRDEPKSLHLYSKIAFELIDSSTDFHFHGWSRAARFRIILFGYEVLTFLRGFWSETFGTEVYRLKSAIYRSFLNFFEYPKSWSIQSRDLYEYEIRTNAALVDYVEKDSAVPLRFSESLLLQNSMESLMISVSSTSHSTDNLMVFEGKASTGPSSPVAKASSGSPMVTLRHLIKYFLIHENESIKVWLGAFKAAKMTLPPRAFWREIAAFARDQSPLLAIRFCQMVKLEPEHGLVIPPSVASRSSFFRYIQSVSILEYFIAAGLEVMNTDCFIFAEPISPPLAIAIFRRAEYKSKPIYLNYAMRSLEAYPPELLFFYIPQIVQNLRHDENGYTDRTIMHIASVSALFAHQVIWNMNANMYIDDAGSIPDPMKPTLEAMVLKIVIHLHGSDRDFYEREFAFFEKVTGISGLLKPFIRKEKWEKKKKIDEELAKIAVDPGVYLPSNPESCVIDIDYSSGRPLQSFAKAPFMATFKVKSLMDEAASAAWQSCIFKVGDDCRQDVMTLQIISSIKTIFEMSHLHLYLFPYRVVATAPGCGVIEVIPNSISRDMLGREKINSLYEYFWFKYGNPNGIAFQTAREEFIKSMAAYSVITYLVAIRDRHNGNIMIDDQGHIIHIDFGFVLDIAPGGITFERSPFKLTSEMIQVMGGKEDSSPYFAHFVNYCVEAFLVLRPHAENLIQLVEGVKESGLPCFKLGEASIRNLRSRFRLDLDEAEARNFFANLVNQSSENVRTDLYDAYQNYKNGIPY